MTMLAQARLTSGTRGKEGLSETLRVHDTTLLDWITAIGTLGAVVVAVWATIGSQRAVHRELEVGALVTRRREAMELLQALEAIQTFRWQHDGGSIKRRIAEKVLEELLRAEASCAALLRVSEENLPIANGMAFRHITYGSTHDAEKAYLDQASEIGDVETESREVLKARGDSRGDRGAQRAHPICGTTPSYRVTGPTRERVSQAS